MRNRRRRGGVLPARGRGRPSMRQVGPWGSPVFVLRKVDDGPPVVVRVQGSYTPRQRAAIVRAGDRKARSLRR